LPYLYVPAFSSGRSVIQRLGYTLTERQPLLTPLAEGRKPGGSRPQPVRSAEDVPPVPGAFAMASVGARLEHASVDTTAGSGQGASASSEDESGFDLFSPVVLGRQDSRVLSHFVYLVLRSGETRDLGLVDYRLDVVAEELAYVPAVWDPRHIHDANWRLLLVEFDDLVA